MTTRLFWSTLAPALAIALALGPVGCEQRDEPARGDGTASTPNSSAPKDPKLHVSKKATPDLAYVTNGVASFWTIAEVGAKAAGRDLAVNVDVQMPTSGVDDQKRIIEGLLARGVDGIAVSPIDPANQTDLLNEAAGRTNLITHDSDAPRSRRLLYIGMDNYMAGRMCGELVREALPSGGNIMIFVGRIEQLNARQRRQGLIDELLGRSVDPERYDPPGKELKDAGSKYVILDTRTDQFDFGKAKSLAEDAIAQYGDNLHCMVGLFAYNPPKILEAVKQGGKVGKIQIVAFDEEGPTLDGIKDGSVYGTVVQNPYEYGYQSIKTLAALAKGDKSVIPPSGFIDIPARKIRKDTVEAFARDLDAKLKAGSAPAKK